MVLWNILGLANKHRTHEGAKNFQWFPGAWMFSRGMEFIAVVHPKFHTIKNREDQGRTESMKIETIIEPVYHAKITPFDNFMFTKTSPNFRTKSICFAGQNQPKMYMQFFYMEVDHIGLRGFKHGIVFLIFS